MPEFGNDDKLGMIDIAALPTFSPPQVKCRLFISSIFK